VPTRLHCPACNQFISLGEDQCSHCGQPLCPACGKGITDEAARCDHCGAEFEFACPACGEKVDAAAITCPHCQTELGAWGIQGVDKA
jgi:predicted amidophosphoribosyltransferase